jgi:hypothetical protein
MTPLSCSLTKWHSPDLIITDATTRTGGDKGGHMWRMSCRVAHYTPGAAGLSYTPDPGETDVYQRYWNEQVTGYE